MNDSLKVFLGALGGAVLALLLAAVFRGGGMVSTGSMMGGGIFGALFMLLFWVLGIALLVALIVWIVGPSRRR
jgi:uncharacterized membrane protein